MIRVIRGHGMTRELREGLFASLVMIVMIITGCTGPSPAPAPHSTIASPAASTASDLEAAIRSGDLETLEIALAGGADANAPFALGFPITGLVGSDLRAAYARWVKFNALLFSTIYTHLSRFCPEAERKNQEMLSLLEPDHGRYGRRYGRHEEYEKSNLFGFIGDLLFGDRGS